MTDFSSSAKFYELSHDTDGVIWLSDPANSFMEPYCREHRVKLVYSSTDAYSGDEGMACPEDGKEFNFARGLEIRKGWARDKVNHSSLKGLKLMRVDTEGYQVLAKETVATDPRYWIEAKLSDTSKGLQLMVQVGKKGGDGKKVQLFVEPPAKRLSFDHSEKDQHPTGIFAEVTAIFKDSETSIVAITE